MGRSYRAIALATLSPGGPLALPSPKAAFGPPNERELLPPEPWGGGWPMATPSANVFVSNDIFRSGMDLSHVTAALALAPAEGVVLGIPPQSGVAAAGGPVVSAADLQQARSSAGVWRRARAGSQPGQSAPDVVGFLQDVGNAPDEVLEDDAKRMEQYATILARWKATNEAIAVAPTAVRKAVLGLEQKMYERQAVALWMNEYRLGDNGCLADSARVDPGKSRGNRCDFSYQGFVEAGMTVWEKRREADLAACESSVANAMRRLSSTRITAGVSNPFTEILGNPANQIGLYPCEERGNFTRNAFAAETFFFLQRRELDGLQCETFRLNASLGTRRRALGIASATCSSIRTACSTPCRTRSGSDRRARSGRGSRTRRAGRSAS